MQQKLLTCVKNNNDIFQVSFSKSVCNANQQQAYNKMSPLWHLGIWNPELGLIKKYIKIKIYINIYIHINKVFLYT